MHLDFRRGESPGPLPGHAQPVVVPFVAETGREIKNVIEASVSSEHGKPSRMTVTVMLPREKPKKK